MSAIRPPAPGVSSRRHFLARGAALAALAATGPAVPSAAEPAQPAAQDWSSRVFLFTDHLSGFDLSYAEVARQLAELKIAGPDLTVRPGGIVRPERVREELPKAVAAFRDAGLGVPMLTTEITSATPAAKDLLTVASQQGIRYYKLGYYRYADSQRWKEQLAATRQEVSALAKLNGELGIVAGFHNHSGPLVGGATWDLAELLAPLDARSVGAYFDVAHATIEGGLYGWELGLRLLAPRLAMIALKDFVWEKTASGWQPRWVPLGEGMVRWPEFFRVLASTPFAGPISLHIEYDPGGRTKPERIDKGREAAARDLDFLRRQLAKAQP